MTERINSANNSMATLTADELKTTLERCYAAESRRVYASLVRLLRDFDLAEEALHDAFAAAAETWARDGVPDNPRAWLVSTGRFRAIDTLRRRGLFDAAQRDLADRSAQLAAGNPSESVIDDDQLRLVFTCCHPAIDRGVQIPLTLREVCGLTTEEIAHAFLVPAATMAQRLVRGKAKIRDAAIPIVIPEAQELPERLDSVLAVIYLVFNEGYSASRGETQTRADLSVEAIRLGRLVAERLPRPESLGLVALMLLQDSRRLARTTPAGDIVLLEQQDRTAWDAAAIRDGLALVEGAGRLGPPGPYLVQAHIAAVHARAATAAATDWPRIVTLYETLHAISPSPVVELNTAVAVAMAAGPAAGLARIDAILARGDLADYHLAHAAQADLFRRLNRRADAKRAYEKALKLTLQEPERRFLTQRIAELGQDS